MGELYTAAAKFQLPLMKIEHATFQTDCTAELFRQAHLLVIDEVTMGHRHMFEAIDRTLRDIRERDCMFGGLTIVFAGYWRQILPVVQHGSRSDIVSACLKKSYIWDAVQSLELTENVHA